MLPLWVLPAASTSSRHATSVRQRRHNQTELDPTEPCIEYSRFLMSSGREWGEYYQVAPHIGLGPNEVRNPCHTLVACLTPRQQGLCSHF